MADVTDLEDDIALTDEERALAERGSALVAAAMAHPEARAPQALRESLERGMVAERVRRPWLRRPRRRLAAAGIAAVCLLMVALVVALGEPDDGVGPPSVQQVAAVTRLPTLQAAPDAVGGGLPRLSAAVQGLAFPDWRRAFGWRATGRRTDRIGNRAVTTVFYRYSGRRLGYAIVAGSPLRPGAGRDLIRGGARYRVVTRGGRTTVTWTQAGHTCVIDAPTAVATAELVTLAAWANI
jgi:hypothetical protein